MSRKGQAALVFIITLLLYAFGTTWQISQLTKQNHEMSNNVTHLQQSLDDLSHKTDDQNKLLQQQYKGIGEQVKSLEDKVKQVDDKASNPPTLSSRGGFLPPPTESPTLNIRATAYGASVQNGGAGTGKTAMGTSPIEGHTIAVDPNVIALGSKVHIECPTFPSINGEYLAEDVGGAINGNRIDIYMSDGNRQRMLEFGIRDIQVKVLK